MNISDDLSWNLQRIASAVKGSQWLVRGHANEKSVQEWVFDTRRCTNPEGALFLALVGENKARDGHGFLGEAYRIGIRVFLVRLGVQYEWPSADPNLSVLAVPDPLKALQVMASEHRRCWGGPVWAITGSNGKTQVKEWIAELIQSRVAFAKTPGSFNSQLGLPLSVLGLKAGQDLGIFEAGISQKGEMSPLAQILSPQGGLLTHFGEAHQEGFESMAQKLQEKLLLFDSCDWVVARLDSNDSHKSVWKETVLRNSETIFHWWTDEKDESDWFRVLESEGVARKRLVLWKLVTKSVTENGSTLCELQSEGQSTLRFEVAGRGEAVLENMTGAVLMIAAGGLWNSEWGPRCAMLRTLPMRMEIKEIPGSCRLLNDSYSLDADSFQWAMREWALQVGDSEGLIILSEPDSPKSSNYGTGNQDPFEPFIQILHRYPWKRLYLVGKNWRRVVWPSNPTQSVQVFDDTEEFLQKWPLDQSEHACVLLKGARKFGFERIEQKLLVQGHQTVLEIDLEAVRHNYGIFRSLNQPGVRSMVMVKAGAYGSGSVEIARVLQEAGADYLAVATAGEGIELRRGGIQMPILVMNSGPTSTDTVIHYGLEPDLYSLEEIKRWSKSPKSPSFFHIPLDTGMRRLGLGAEDLDEALDLLALYATKMRIRSIYTHLTSSEEPGQDAFSARQWKSLLEFVNAFEQRLGYRPWVHALNTAGILRFNEYQGDMVRLGLGLYGLEPTGQLQERLKPLARFKTTLAQTHRLAKGQTLGYGNQGVMERDGVVGVLPVGYADGLPRALGLGRVFFEMNGCSVPTIGRISMDFCLVDLTDVRAAVGDEVLLWSNARDVRAWAEAAGTIPYEILTGLSPRVQRVYIRG
jgi:alanine racemase